jgi:hypothetical protein
MKKGYKVPPGSALATVLAVEEVTGGLETVSG